MNRKTAFTVIEVLVIVVTAAVLMAVLLPASAMVRRSARDAQCQMNMRQLGACFDMYTKDNNTFFTDGTGYGGMLVIGDWLAWLDGGYKYESGMSQAQIDQTKDLHRGLSYLKDYRLLTCPMAPTAADNVPTKFRGWIDRVGVSGGGAAGTPNSSILPYGKYGEVVGGYAHNAWCNNVPANIQNRWGYNTAYCWRTTAVENASEVGVLADSPRWAFDPQATNPPPKYDGDPGGGTWNEMPRVCIDRHDGAINVLYMDWSVRRAPLKTLWNIKWHRNWDNELAQAGGPPPVWPTWMRDF